MNEEPKSIWKNLWTGLCGLYAWLMVVVATFFIILVVTLFIPGGPRSFSDWWPTTVLMLFASVIVATVIVGFWTFIRRFFCWSNFRRLMFATACLATLIALFYAEEDWRGWRTWSQFKRTWEAKGEHFSFAGLVPPPVPDEQNFALTPVVASSYLCILDKQGHRINPPNTNVVNRLGMPISLDAYWNICPTNGSWAKGTKTDLKEWQSYYREVATTTNLFPVPAQPQSPAADVLLALSNYDPVIGELREASRLPGSRFPLNYDSESPSAILLPHLVALRRCSVALQLRSLAELQNGQPEKAVADVMLGLQLTDKIRTEPFLISHLVRIAMMQIMLQPVYEGLAEHRWSDEQLAALDAELAKLDFAADYQLSMRGELGCQGGEMDRLRRHPELIQGLIGYSDGQIDIDGNDLTLPGKIAARLIPTGWLYQNQYRCARMMVEYLLPAADVNQGTFSPALVRHGGAALETEIKPASPFNVLERLMLPGLGAGARRFAYAQSSVNLARTAIALERYRLAQGAYPEALDALVPQFIAKLPHDVIGGQPLHYHLEANGQFVLYSVGWNEADDGGEVGLTKNGNLDNATGDWVWRYPMKAE